MSYTNDEIKKMLDSAVKKVRVSIEESKRGETSPDNAAAPQADISASQEAPSENTAGESAHSQKPAQDIAGKSESLQNPAQDAANRSVSQQDPARDAAGRSASLEIPAQGTANRSAPRQKPTADSANRPSPRQRAAQGQSATRAASQKSGTANQRTPSAPVASSEKEDARTFDISPEGILIERSASDGAISPDLDTGPEDFKIKFDFDSAYKDVPDDRPLRLRRERRTGCVGGLLYSIFVICISLVLASLAWLAATDILGFATVDESVNVTVPRGFTIEDIVDTLYDSELIRYKFLFKLYADYSNAEEKISAGSYVLNKNYDYRALVHGMTTRGGVLVETTVTIPEGYSLAEIFLRLEDYGVCHAADLWEAATNHDFDFSFLDESTIGERLRLEGFLFPDTYNFYLDSSAVQVINRLLREFDNRFTETYVERAEELGYSIREIITIASMIEREAGSDEERSRISAVIHNRLNNSANFPWLQIDATIIYAIGSFSRDIDNPYNTYMYEGLPPTPIASPGAESIHAALYPDSTNEYYYALNKQGTHEFFRTLAQHEAFVASEDFGGR